MPIKVPSLFEKAVLWWPGQHCAGYTNDFDEFPIIPSGVSITNSGTWTKTDLGNNRLVLVFNGTINDIIIGNSTDFNLGANNFTVFAWVYKTNTDYGLIFGDQDGTGGNHRVSWMFQMLSSTENNAIRFAAVNSSVTIFVDLRDTVSLLNGWNCVAAIRSGSSWVLSVNGISVATATSSDTIRNHDVAARWFIGASLESNGTTWHVFGGSISNLLILNGKALSLAEITALMRLTHPITGPGIIPGPYDYWRLTA